LFCCPGKPCIKGSLPPPPPPPHTPQTFCRELALVPPLLGSSQRLLLRDHTETYYAGMPLADGTSTPLRRHGDEVQALPGGYFRALGRCDDTMNLGGIKVGSSCCCWVDCVCWLFRP
jgi:hypothetical protein